MNAHNYARWRITADETGTRLLAFLRAQYADLFSTKALKRAIERKCCIVNGQTEVFASHALQEGDVVAFDFEEPSVIHTIPILHEDEDFLIIDKPAGVISEQRFLSRHITQKFQLIHRLDKETSGVLLLAKNKGILEEMILLFREKKVRKHYLALVDGAVAQQEGQIEKPLHEKYALTKWRLLKKGRDASLLLCEPITGRTHQLRVHLHAMGHPILGDTHYARRFRCSLRPKRHLLHASRIAFIHPKTGKELQITSPLPAEFTCAVHALHFNH